MTRELAQKSKEPTLTGGFKYSGRIIALLLSGSGNISAMCSEPTGTPAALAKLQVVEDDGDRHILDLVYEILNKNSDVFSLMPRQVSDVRRIVIKKGPGHPRRNEFEPESGTLYIASPVCKNLDRPVGDRDLLPIALHEFGHALFEASLSQILKKEYLARPDNIGTRNELLFKYRESEAGELPLPMVQLVLPYHELLADSIAVLLIEDPEAMSRFFGLCNGDTDKRNFAREIPVSGWNVGPLVGTFDRRHQLFNPVRTMLWAVYKRELKADRAKRKYILAALTEAVVGSVRALAQGSVTYASYATIDQEKLNRDLLSAFERSLKKRLNLD